MTDELNSDIKKSLLAGDKIRVETLKMLKTAFQYAAIQKGSDLTEADFQTIVLKEIKKRQEAAELYSSAGVSDKATAELAEVAVLEAYAPKLLSENDLRKAVLDLSDQFTGKNFGEVMQLCLKEISGIDKSMLARIIKEVTAG